MIELLIISILLLGLAIAGIAIKMFVKKDGEFQKVCGSVDPDTGQRLSCTCGKASDEMCDNEDRRIMNRDIEFEEITAR